jgi:hypothetical protein
LGVQREAKVVEEGLKKVPSWLAVEVEAEVEQAERH